ncbi:glycosyltransferase, partial [Candidatus Daviesbacteria bacterium]|nr:glycosyltransferase [Candidatus Daviesbacteria bacterium]
MKTIDFSWIIPIYNEAQALPELFEEIKQVNLKKYEIVAINDGSTD